MSMRESIEEMSENNATIAENQQKVYDAGVRAGKAQDVDYADGYGDGYEAGVSDASGGVWDSLISGETPVGKAVEADRAATATYAITAGRAEEATHAENASHSNSADNATEAEMALNAQHAQEAEYSVEAQHSATSDYATNAGHATEADQATNASHATNATTATSATNADHATEADYASVAGRASAAYASGTVSAVLSTVAGYNFYKVSIALGVSPKVLILVHNTYHETVICASRRYVYNGDVYSGDTTYSDGTFSLNFPAGNPVGPGSGSWSYVAIM